MLSDNFREIVHQLFVALEVALGARPLRVNVNGNVEELGLREPWRQRDSTGGRTRPSEREGRGRRAGRKTGEKVSAPNPPVSHHVVRGGVECVIEGANDTIAAQVVSGRGNHGLSSDR